MRIFVTGASGFIGRHLLEASAGHELMCLTRRPKELMAGRGTLAHVQTLQGDLGSARALAAPNCNASLPIAASISPGKACRTIRRCAASKISTSAAD